MSHQSPLHGARGALATLLASLALACGGPANPTPRPNVLLVTIDTLRPDYLSLNGYDRATSPHLDAIAKRGVYFERAVSPIARTTPALASLLTGSYPHTTGLRTLTGTLRSEVTTLTEVLRDAGYQTVAVVSNQVLVRRRGLDRGFDVYDMQGDDRPAKATTDAALRALAALEPDLPVFAWIHFIDPHTPYHSDPAIAARMDPGYTGRYRFHFGWSRQLGEPPGTHSAFPHDLPKRVATHENPLPEKVNAHVRRLYAADIRALDDQVGRLFASPLLGDDWIVVVTADHGESLGEHDFYFDHGDYVYNAGTRVPLVIALPPDHPLHRSGRCAQWVGLVDVVPTLLELLGRELPGEQVEGRSLVPCLRGESLADEPVFSESGWSFFPDAVKGLVRNDVAGRFRSVTHGDWKLVWTPFAPDASAWRLFDVRNDPDETRDLYRPDHPAVPALKSALAEWVARAAPDSPDAALTAEDIEALRQLGYLETPPE